MPSATINTEIRAVWTSEKGSMAKQTAETRWPKIIQGTIDDIAEVAAAEDVEEGKRAESIAIRIALKHLKQGIEQNKSLTYVTSPGTETAETHDMLGSCKMMASSIFNNGTNSWLKLGRAVGPTVLGSLESATCTGMAITKED